MKKFIINLIKVFIVIFVVSCSNQKKSDTNKNDINLNLKNMYSEAMIELNKGNYEEAQIIFNEIKLKFPLTNESIQSQIMIGFIEYSNLNYDTAILQFDRVIKKYPSHKNIDYVYYMKALSYYEQINKETLDGNNNIQALDSFNQILNRFPQSKYAKDSEQKIILVKEIMAAKHMDIGFFYLNQKKYLAALNRFKKVIDEYSTSKFTPEALHRLIEIYSALGMKKDAEKTLAVLGYNYPKSKWYEFSYELVFPDTKKENNFSFNKLLNLFEKNEQEK